MRLSFRLILYFNASRLPPRAFPFVNDNVSRQHLIPEHAFVLRSKRQTVRFYVVAKATVHVGFRFFARNWSRLIFWCVVPAAGFPIYGPSV